MTNKEVLVCATETRSLSKMIWCSKHTWLGHVLRLDNLLHDVTEGKMLGKHTRGRKRMELSHNMIEGRDYEQSKDLISDRSK